MIWPKISIVTPSFNQADFLEATIHSVLSQDYPNLEYIIIDGGSTDGSAEIIRKYANDLHFWCSEPDNGLYDAVNKGFAKSSGEIMAWVNSDDMYFPWTFRTVASIMSEKPQVEWLTTLNPGGWDWHGFLINFANLPGYSRDAFLDGCYSPWGKRKASAMGWIQLESTFWKRSLWEKAGNAINTDLELAAEFEMWSRFFSHTELYATYSPLGGFRYQGNQKSILNYQQYVDEAEKVITNSQKIANWRPSLFKKIFRTYKSRRIPMLRNFIISRYGYTGHRIVRIDVDSPTGSWEVQEYKFL